MPQQVSTKNDVVKWYGAIWHRNPRTDEIDAHLKWKTPFSRLINWLVDNTPDNLIGWNWPIAKELEFKINAYFHDPRYKKQWGFEHEGLDIDLPNSTDSIKSNVLAAGQGVIESIGFDDGVKWPRKGRKPFGNHVIIRHNKKYRTLYGHLQSIDVVPGWFVPNDYKLGIGDSTGWSSGPHIHFELHEKTLWGWKKINPLTKIKT